MRMSSSFAWSKDKEMAVDISKEASPMSQFELEGHYFDYSLERY